ncbi:MAG: hypothetical protein HYW78_01635 [Parcubacteria group bacterium]|nr:hypothetical protein [Parcubacteria group bacterium]
MSLKRLFYLFLRDFFIVSLATFIILLFLEAIEYGAVTFWFDLTAFWMIIMGSGIIAFILNNLD